MNILNIKHVKEDDLYRAGKKAAMLGSVSGNFNIAPGYVLTKDIFQAFVEHNDLGSKIRQLFGSSELHNKDILQKKANEMQKLVLAGQMPPELQEGLIEAYYSLNINDSVPINEMVESQQEPIVVVRASPVEDAETLSIIHVQGKEKLIKSIIAVFASIFTASSILTHKERDASPEIAVIMQKMLMPNISGFILSSEHGTVVKACYGLSDESTGFDHYLISDDKLQSSIVHNQDSAFVQDPKTLKFTKMKLPESKGTGQKLNEKQAVVLARLWNDAGLQGKKIEYIIDQDNYYFVQVTEGKMSDEKENTIFSLFNANKGEKKPEIPSEPNPDPTNKQAGQDVAQGQEAEPQKTEPSQEPMQAQEPAQSQETPQETESMQQMNATESAEPEPVQTIESQQPQDELKSEQLSPSMQPEPVKSEPVQYQVPEEESAETQTEETVETVKSEQMQSAPPSSMPTLQASDTTVDEEVLEHADQPMQPHEVDTDSVASVQPSVVKPLNKDEWLETLETENTKALMAYHMIILGVLKRKYQEVVGGQPQDFRQMLQALNEHTQVPHKEKLLVLHNLRNRFYTEHKNVSIAELSGAHEATKEFISDFL